jgi:hypothetical protein
MVSSLLFISKNACNSNCCFYRFNFFWCLFMKNIFSIFRIFEMNEAPLTKIFIKISSGFIFIFLRSWWTREISRFLKAPYQKFFIVSVEHNIFLRNQLHQNRYHVQLMKVEKAKSSCFDRFSWSVDKYVHIDTFLKM